MAPDAGPPVPTFVLTERVPGECDLTPADVAFLLAEHGTRLRLLPTARPGRYRLTSLGHVGVIVAPNCRLILKPKVPLKSLFYLLDPAALPPPIDDRVTPAPGTEALDFLAARLAQLMTARAAHGLHRAYREEAGPLRFLQGRLDLPAQARVPGRPAPQLHCRFEEFTADVPCNQVPRATAELTLRCPLLGPEVRATLRQALVPYADVQPVALDAATFAAARPDRRTDAYAPLLDLCRLLADSLGPQDAAGTDTCPSFLLDMQRVFEQYVTTAVLDAFADGRATVAVQPLLPAHGPVSGQPAIHVRPDVLVEHRGRPVLVIDAKWKRLPRSAVPTADVYQVLAYCTALGVRRAVLVYPASRERVWTYPVAENALRLELRVLPVTGSRAACRRGRDRLGRLLRKGALSG
jgi:5-methylcytosine-specific restriction enzyme subunit McrC